MVDVAVVGVIIIVVADNLFELIRASQSLRQQLKKLNFATNKSFLKMDLPDNSGANGPPPPLPPRSNQYGYPGLSYGVGGQASYPQYNAWRQNNYGVSGYGYSPYGSTFSPYGNTYTPYGQPYGESYSGKILLKFHCNLELKSCFENIKLTLSLDLYVMPVIIQLFPEAVYFAHYVSKQTTS